MNQNCTLRVVFVVILIILVCTLVHAQEIAINAAIQSIKQHYAPDPTLAVFDIKYKETDAGIIVRGEVDNPEAKTTLLAALKNVTAKKILDKVRILPDLSLGNRIYGIVTLSVCNVHPRPSETKKLSSQLLMGTVIKLLKKRGGCYFVQSPDCYLGWLDQLSFVITSKSGIDAWLSLPKVIVTDYFGVVREQPNVESMPVCDVVMGCVLKSIGRNDGWTAVELADGRKGFILDTLVRDFAVWKNDRTLSSENIEKTAKALLGIPYLWGGTSVKGVDCSGFTKTVYWLNGMELLRDANQQATMGVDVEPGVNFGNLKKGDLIFFSQKATAKQPKHITHVAISLGQKFFIHSSGRVRYGSFDSASPNFEPSLLSCFICARRIIQD